MTDVQEDQLSMQQTCLVVRDTYATEIGAVPDLNDDFDDLQDEVDGTNEQLQEQGRTTTGITTDKQVQEHNMIEMALVIAGAVMAFARTTGNNTLFDEMNISKSKLQHERDQTLGNTCLFIHGRANTHLASLAGRGITSTILTDFMTLITGYVGQEQAPRTAATQKSAATTSIDDHIHAGQVILKDRLDPGMRIFLLSNPAIVTVWENARKIVTTGRRHQKNVLAYQVKDENGNALAGVLVTAGGVTRTTDSHGRGVIKGMAAGNVSAHFAKPGYLDQYVNATITEGQTTTVTVTLIRAVGAISGNVSSPTLSGPFNVTVQGQAGGATTDGSGNFTLTDIPAGSQTVVCVQAANPANTLNQTVTVTAGGTVTVNFNFP